MITIDISSVVLGWENMSCPMSTCVLFGRQGLEGPLTKAMLSWLGAYKCYWLSIYLSGYISMSHHRVSHLVFTVFGLAPLQLPCQKDQPGHRCFHSNILNCLPPLLALCVLLHVCMRLIILTGSKNNNKIKIAEMKVASWHPPL